MNSYLVVESGPRVSIHKAKAHGVGFKTLAQAYDFIDHRRLNRVQIIARAEDGTRRWLDWNEQQELEQLILEAAAF